jgi:hypothetical protein
MASFIGFRDAEHASGRTVSDGVGTNPLVIVVRQVTKPQN